MFKEVGKMVGEAAAMIGGATVGLGLPDVKKTIEERKAIGKSPITGTLAKGFYRLGSPIKLNELMSGISSSTIKNKKEVIIIFKKSSLPFAFIILINRDCAIIQKINDDNTVNVLLLPNYIPIQIPKSNILFQF